MRKRPTKLLAHVEDNRGYTKFDFISIDEVKRKRSWKRQLLFLMGLYVAYNVVYCFVKSRK
ncbi:group-specific protein [Bacillus cereus E33L]|uniref:Group-specific protein n=1 Tax=Bacillus cereus (strain ZK / E33L) TaxID=288681 RepID=Q631G6_BACCZ|nr:group-specific protein [Bacillus cereus E33L]